MDVANIRIHNSQEHPFQVSPFEEAQVFETGEDFSLQNGYIRAHFNKDGFLQDITTLDDKVKTEMKLEFIKVWNLKKAIWWQFLQFLRRLIQGHKCDHFDVNILVRHKKPWW